MAMSRALRRLITCREWRRSPRSRVTFNRTALMPPSATIRVWKSLPTVWGSVLKSPGCIPRYGHPMQECSISSGRSYLGNFYNFPTGAFHPRHCRCPRIIVAYGRSANSRYALKHGSILKSTVRTRPAVAVRSGDARQASTYVIIAQNHLRVPRQYQCPKTCVNASGCSSA